MWLASQKPCPLYSISSNVFLTWEASVRRTCTAVRRVGHFIRLHLLCPPLFFLRFPLQFLIALVCRYLSSNCRMGGSRLLRWLPKRWALWAHTLVLVCDVWCLDRPLTLGARELHRRREHATHQPPTCFQGHCRVLLGLHVPYRFSLPHWTHHIT